MKRDPFPCPTAPFADGESTIAKWDRWEQRVYSQGWWWGFICGATCAALVSATAVIGWSTWSS
jgi:hypothetical protein